MNLRKYVLYRLVMMMVTIFILLTFIFFVVRILPGDPVAAMVGEDASQATIDAIRQRLGLDRPLHIQYMDYIAGLFTGNLGESIIYSRNIGEIIIGRAGVTIQLAILSFILSSTGGVFLGRYTARKVGEAPDHVLRVITVFFYGVPVFVLGIAVQYLFGGYLRILPVFGTHSSTVRPPKVTGLILLDTLLAGDFGGFLNAFSHFILPVACISTWMIAVTLRMTRGETIKFMKRKFCLLAQAKGLKHDAVINKHAFRNALLPIVTIIGFQAGGLLTGSVLVETVFSLNGLGSLLYMAASARDFILLQAVLGTFVFVISITGLLVDISYHYLDPRLRF